MADLSRRGEQTMVLWRQVLPALLIHFNGLPIGMGMAFTSVAATSMVSEGVLTTEQNYIFASIYILTVAVGCPLGGLLVDRFGRKLMSIVMSSVSVFGWVVIASTSTAVPLCLGRSLTGISVGFVAVIAIVYVVEITTKQVRGMLGIMYYMMVTTGILVDLVIGSILPWRYLALLGAAISAAILLGTLVIPESPRWLLQRGRPEEAMTELLRLRGRHADIHAEYTEMETCSSSSSLSVSIGTLLHPTHVKPVLLSFAAALIINLSGMNIVFSYLDVILSRSGWDENISTPRMLLGVAQFMATILSMYIITVTGRRQVLLAGLSIITFSTAVLGCVYYFQHMLDSKTYRWLASVLIFMYLIAYNFGIGSVAPLLRSELLPTKIRATVSGYGFSLSCVIGFIMTQTYPYALDTIRDYGVFWILAVLSLICFLFVVFFLPETKDKSLEEIEIEFLEADELNK